jgi:hypothetical protein
VWGALRGGCDVIKDGFEGGATSPDELDIAEARQVVLGEVIYRLKLTSALDEGEFKAWTGPEDLLYLTHKSREKGDGAP